jgi:hypothetical protein
MNTVNVWKGVIIQEGLKDSSILEHVKIVKTDMERLEEEEGLGDFHFHKVEVNDQDLNTVVEMAMNGLRESWYMHLVNGERMKVIFSGKVFEVQKGDTNQFKKIKEYAISQGILEEQIEVERLIDNPYDEKPTE